MVEAVPLVEPDAPFRCRICRFPVKRTCERPLRRPVENARTLRILGMDAQEVVPVKAPGKAERHVQRIPPRFQGGRGEREYDRPRGILPGKAVERHQDGIRAPFAVRAGARREFDPDLRFRKAYIVQVAEHAFRALGRPRNVRAVP